MGRAVELRRGGRQCLTIWEMPEDDAIYSIGVDVGAGNSSQDGDFSACSVVRADRKYQVAEYHSRDIEPGDFGDVACALGWFFKGKLKEALVVPEAMNHGHATILRMRDLGYANFYRDKPANSMPSMANGWQQWLDGVGYKTNTRQAKDDLINQARELFREINEPSYIATWGSGIRSSKLMEEIQSFSYAQPKTGRRTPGNDRPQAEDGHHDDLVIAWCLAVKGIEQALAASPKAMAVPDRRIPYFTKVNEDYQSDRIDKVMRERGINPQRVMDAWRRVRGPFADEL